MLKEILLKYLPLGMIYRLRKLHQLQIVLTYYFLRIFPINNRKIIITNYSGKGYGDNGKYIVQEILGRKLNYDLVWIVNVNSEKEFPKQIRTVQYGSLKAIYEEVTAKIWIDNCRKSSLVKKREGQFYIQTWHGGIALKRIEKDVETKLSNEYVENAKHDSAMADLFISNSKFCTELYRSAFWYDGEILECGYPRNDILINCHHYTKHKVFRCFGLDDDTKIILYAPTYRADHNMDVYALDYNQILRALEKKDGCNWMFLVRMHPNISGMADAVTYNEKVINATHYDDMQELMGASDILITDYSSTMFEFMLMQKPVFLYATDLEEYILERDFYFDIFSLPFPLAKSNEELIEYLISFSKVQYLNGLISFANKLVLMEAGKAAKKIVDRIEMIIGSAHQYN